MIELVNVSKYYPTDFGRHYIFRDVSLVLPLDKSVGVLGPNGAGKSTFLRLLGGADMPSEGKILRSGRISPPMGLTPGLQSSLTASENARFAGRIYGMDRDEIVDLIEYVRELANIGNYFDMPIGTYSAGMRQRVAFAINMSMNFDYYLFDEIGAGGDKDFRKTATAMVQQRLKTSKFIIASHRQDELLEICESGIVIQNGGLTFYDDIKDALAAYGGEDEKPDRRSRRAKRRAEQDGISGGDPVAEPLADGSAAAPALSRRERRRLKRLAKKEQLIAAGAQAVEPEAVMPGPQAEAAHPDPMAAETETEETGEALENKRLQRRMKRMLEKRQATVADIESVEPEAAAAEATEPVPPEAEPEETGEATGEAPVNKRLQRRLKRILEKQEARVADAEALEPESAGIETDSSESTEGEDRETLREQRRLMRLSQKQDAAPSDTPAAVAELPETDGHEAGDDEEHLSRRERRRLKRLTRQEQDGPVDDTAVEAEGLVSEPSSPAADEDRASFREQRRLKRKLKKLQASDPEEMAPAPDTVGSETLPAPNPLPMPEPRAQAHSPLPPVPAAAVIPPVGKAPLAARLPPRPRGEPVPPAAAGVAATPSVAQPATPSLPQPATPSVPQPASSASPAAPLPFRFLGAKGFLAELATRRQSHAQTTAARATRLLLQHLDDLANSGRASSQARAWLVSSAQETAAMEASQARDMLDKILSGDAAPKSPAASPFRTSPFSFSDTSNATRPALRRAAPSLNNPD